MTSAPALAILGMSSGTSDPALQRGDPAGGARSRDLPSSREVCPRVLAAAKPIRRRAAAPLLSPMGNPAPALESASSYPLASSRVGSGDVPLGGSRAPGGARVPHRVRRRARRLTGKGRGNARFGSAGEWRRVCSVRWNMRADPRRHPARRFTFA